MILPVELCRIPIETPHYMSIVCTSHALHIERISALNSDMHMCT
jgi:hypothetical protein